MVNFKSKHREALLKELLHLIPLQNVLFEQMVANDKIQRK